MKELRLEYAAIPPQSKMRKRFLIVLGIIFIVFDLVLIIITLAKYQQKSLLFPAFANFTLGILLVLQALEPKILYPKKYILINPDFVEFKLGGLHKLKNIQWESVDQLSINTNSVLIQTPDNSIKIRMLHFPSSDEKKIKAALNAIAQARNIPTNT